jgi:hypothetical protein
LYIIKLIKGKELCSQKRGLKISFALDHTT